MEQQDIFYDSAEYIETVSGCAQWSLILSVSVRSLT